MSLRRNTIGIVLEVDRASITDEDFNNANNLCEDTNGKLFRILTFALDSVGLEELIGRHSAKRARISYIKDRSGSPIDGKHYQIEEILSDESTTID